MLMRCRLTIPAVEKYLETSLLPKELQKRYKSGNKMPAIQPPAQVKGMKEWNPELFTKEVSLPCIRVKAEKLNLLKKPLKNHVLKLANFQYIQEADSSGQEPGPGQESGPGHQQDKIVFLNPELVQAFSDLKSIQETLEKAEVNESNFSFTQCQLHSENWKPLEKLRYILAGEEDPISGFSTIGHIIHLNLKDYALPYKSVIGTVMLEMPGIRTVVTKTSNIDSTFRNFELEVLAGEPNFEVTVRESGLTYKFDFSKVYWNPRLSTEHGRVVEMLTSRSILFDACAGVGPFAIPAAKNCARVYANDLNPESYKWLQQNAQVNKIKPGRLHSFNLDAQQFLREVYVKQMLLLLQASEHDSENLDEFDDVHITMNLPAMAITFLPVFQGLLYSEKDNIPRENLPLPIVHLYTFSKAADYKADVKERVEENLGCALDNHHLQEIAFVRNVAPNKNMIRASFKVPRDLLFKEKNKRKSEDSNCDDLTTKKFRE